MQLTVNEARTFGGLKECKLLAGEKGLNRVIRCVDSMEIPDIRQWPQQGEFLVTTGYALKDNSEALVQVVEALADKSGSGLALKTRFIGEISRSVLERAEELEIPIFEMPVEMPTISLTEPIVRRVIAGELQSSSKELVGEQLWHQQANFYTELVLGIIPSEKEAFYRAKFLKWPEPPFSLFVLDMDGFREQVENMMEAEILEIKQRTEKILRRVFRKKWLCGCSGRKKRQLFLHFTGWKRNGSFKRTCQEYEECSSCRSWYGCDGRNCRRCCFISGNKTRP